MSGLNRPASVADSCVEQSLEDEECFGVCGQTSIAAGAHFGDATAVFGAADHWVGQRQEGNGVGNCVRLRKRSNALKSEPQERIRHEIRPVGVGRNKASGG